ncbi:MAG: aldehyde dehydrogenase family protein, partial [Alphaproteobacteria bacterium]
MAARTPDLGFEPKGLFIGNSWVAASSGETITTVNPANGEMLGEVPLAGEADVDKAVAAAREAFPGWAALPLTRRAEYLIRLADAIDANAEMLALMDAVDSGNARSGMLSDMKWTSDTYRYFAGLVTEMKGETLSREPGHLNLTLRQPYGVVAKINPFNHPFRFCAEKAAAPLAAGNTVVIKGPEQAPLSSLKLGELVEKIFPPGVINIVTGDGRTGSAMVRHKDVQRIGFVGSVETGRIIAREAAEGLKEVTLELGGKNPIIIFPDADPAKAAQTVIKAMNMNRQGQSCSSTSRVLVHESLHDALAGELARLASEIPIGFPWLEGAEMGPIV